MISLDLKGSREQLTELASWRLDEARSAVRCCGGVKVILGLWKQLTERLQAPELRLRVLRVEGWTEAS